MADLMAEQYFVEIIDSLKKTVRTRTSKMHVSGIPKFVFVCGEIISDKDGNQLTDKELEDKNNKRFRIIKELKSYKGPLKDSEREISLVLPIVSERLYEAESKILIDLLSFEEILCELSDDIILILESDGTKCELGAFAMDPKLAGKMCVINDKKYEGHSSFITEGPIRKIKEINDKTIYLDFTNKAQFDNNMVLKKYMSSLKEHLAIYEANCNNESIDVKNLIYEVLAILEIFEPLTATEIVSLYKIFKSVGSYKFKDIYRKRFSSIESVLRFMHHIDLIEEAYKEENLPMYRLKKDYKFACFHTLFKIKIEEFDAINEDYRELLRLKYIRRWEAVK